MTPENSSWHLFVDRGTYYFVNDSSEVPDFTELIDWDEASFIPLSDGYFAVLIIIRKDNKYGFLMHHSGDLSYGSVIYNSRVEPFIYDEMRILSNSFRSPYCVGYLACRRGLKWDLFRLAERCGNAPKLPSYEKLNRMYCSSFDDALNVAANDRFYSQMIKNGIRWRDIEQPESCECDSIHYIRKWYTPRNVTRLKPNQIFVFGSYHQDNRICGAEKCAINNFGASLTEEDGRTGQCYAIPTNSRVVEVIGQYVSEFISYADSHPELEFLVTRVGCGDAGFNDAQIAPLFADALRHGNIILPESFVKILENI